MLSTLAIGDCVDDPAKHSDCFYWAEKLRLVDLPALSSLSIGNYCFNSVDNVIVKGGGWVWR